MADDPSTPSWAKQAAEQLGAHIYLMEELGDARLRAEQLKAYVDRAVKLVQQAPQRDLLFEVAGDLIHDIPDALFKLHKALQAAAMNAARTDYELLKTELKPEKADELEQALQDVRLRHVQRRSQETLAPMSLAPHLVAQKLRSAAALVRLTGSFAPALPVLQGLVQDLEQGLDVKTASSHRTASVARAATALEALAQGLITPPPGEKPSRPMLAQLLRRVIGETLTVADDALATSLMQAGSRQEVVDGFMKANPSMSKEDAEKAGDEWEKNKDVVKDKAAQAPTLGGFAEGQPADPTKNMSPEDAKKWKEMHDKYKDTIKDKNAASADPKVRKLVHYLKMAKVELIDALELLDAEGGPEAGMGKLSEMVMTVAIGFKAMGDMDIVRPLHMAKQLIAAKGVAKGVAPAESF